MSEENRATPESMVKLYQRIDDLRCVVQIVIFLIIFIFVIQIIQILADPYSPLFDMLFYIIIVAVLFLSAAICFLRTNDKEESVTIPTQI